MKPSGIVNLMVLDRSPRLDVVFHALAHPARRAMIRQLSGGERNLSELAAPLRMTFPAATKHVRVLEAARLVRRRVAGRQHLCRLEAAPEVAGLAVACASLLEVPVRNAVLRSGSGQRTKLADRVACQLQPVQE